MLTLDPGELARRLAEEAADYHDVGQAHVLLVKSAGDRPVAAPVLQGRLVASRSGWALLTVPNQLVRGLFDAMDEPGVELPPGHEGGPFSAHISVMTGEELGRIGGPDKLTERGHTFHYQLGPIRSVEPAGWGEMSRVWFVEVQSPELKKLRASYGLTPLPRGDHEFHITVCVRRKRVLHAASGVAKAAGDRADLPGDGHVPGRRGEADARAEGAAGRRAAGEGHGRAAAAGPEGGDDDGLHGPGPGADAAGDPDAARRPGPGLAALGVDPGPGLVPGGESVPSPLVAGGVARSPGITTADLRRLGLGFRARHPEYDGTPRGPGWKKIGAASLRLHKPRDEEKRPPLYTLGGAVAGLAALAGLGGGFTASPLPFNRAVRAPGHGARVLRGEIGEGKPPAHWEDTGGGLLYAATSPELHGPGAHLNPGSRRELLEGIARQAPGGLETLVLHGHGNPAAMSLGGRVGDRDGWDPSEAVGQLQDPEGLGKELRRLGVKELQDISCETGRCDLNTDWQRRVAAGLGGPVVAPRRIISAPFPQVSGHTGMDLSYNEPGRAGIFGEYPRGPEGEGFTLFGPGGEERPWRHTGRLTVRTPRGPTADVGWASKGHGGPGLLGRLGALAPAAAGLGTLGGILAPSKRLGLAAALGGSALALPRLLDEARGSYALDRLKDAVGEQSLAEHAGNYARVLPYAGLAAAPLLAHQAARWLGRWGEGEANARARDDEDERGQGLRKAAGRKPNPAAEAETERIKENQKKPENQRPHRFRPAEWTHPNGHPRCLRCGDEERVGGMCAGYDPDRHKPAREAAEATRLRRIARHDRRVARAHNPRIRAFGREHGLDVSDILLPLEKEASAQRDYTKDHCPVCGGGAVSACRCRRNDRRCANGHYWEWRDGERIQLDGFHGQPVGEKQAGLRDTLADPRVVGGAIGAGVGGIGGYLAGKKRPWLSALGGAAGGGLAGMGLGSLAVRPLGAADAVPAPSAPVPPLPRLPAGLAQALSVSREARRRMLPWLTRSGNLDGPRPEVSRLEPGITWSDNNATNGWAGYPLELDTDETTDLHDLFRQLEQMEKGGAAHPALADLKAAKLESDRGNYPAKRAILNRLLAEHPEDFVVDSTLNRFAGLTHRGTGFRIHHPLADLPPGLRKVAADFAPGLPAKSDLGDLSRVRAGQLLDYIVQKHDATRAGTHFDVRFGNEDTGLYSWAARKGLPGPGGKHLAVQQPVHRHGYKDFEGEIARGYGKGTVRKHAEGQVLITKATPDSVHFTTAHQRHPERFVLRRPSGWASKDWLLLNVTPTEKVPYEKLRYRKIPVEQVEPALRAMQTGDSVEAKIDGASQLIRLARGHAELLSFRTSKETGRPIVHTERFFGGRPEVRVPPHLEGTVLKGEMYAARQAENQPAPEAAAGPDAGARGRDDGAGPRGGLLLRPADGRPGDDRGGGEPDGPDVPAAGAVPEEGPGLKGRGPNGQTTGPRDVGDHQPGHLDRAGLSDRPGGGEVDQPAPAPGVSPGEGTPGPQDVGTLLNSSIGRSLQLQREQGLTPRVMAYDVQQYGRTPIDPRAVPRDRRREMMAEVLSHLPPDRFHGPEVAHTPDAARALWDRIRSGKHPLTQEGLILHPRQGVPSKMKLTDEHDVYVTGIFPGLGRRQATFGGFTYGHEPGKTVGKVGSGFSDAFLAEAARDPAPYIGRVARVRAQEKLPSGALRAPVFLGLHEDINKVAGHDSNRVDGQDQGVHRRARPGADGGRLHSGPVASHQEVGRLSGRPTGAAVRADRPGARLADLLSGVIHDQHSRRAPADGRTDRRLPAVLAGGLPEAGAGPAQGRGPDSARADQAQAARGGVNDREDPQDQDRGGGQVRAAGSDRPRTKQAGVARQLVDLPLCLRDGEGYCGLIPDQGTGDAILRLFAPRTKAAAVHDAWSDKHAGLLDLVGHDPAVPQQEPQGLSLLRRAGDRGLRTLAEVRGVSGGYGSTAAGPDPRAGGQRRPLLTGQLQVGDPDRTGEEQAKQPSPDSQRADPAGSGLGRTERGPGKHHQSAAVSGLLGHGGRGTPVVPRPQREKIADLLPWVNLQPQQSRVAKRVGRGENLLVYHGLGSGKSLASLAAAESAGGPYAAVVPASLRDNYKGEIAKFTDRTTPSEVLSYTGVGMGKAPRVEPSTVIMDEVQRIRNPASAGSRAAMELAMRAPHRVLLSGTPIVNEPHDLAVPLSILTGKELTPREFDRRFVGEKTVSPGLGGWLRGVEPGRVPTLKNEDDLERLLEGHVDYHPSRAPAGVNTADERVEVDLSPEQQEFYKLMWGRLPWLMRWKLSRDYPLSSAELKHLSSFMTGPRQAALSLYPFHSSRDPIRAYETSAKLQSAMTSLRQTLDRDPRAKAIVYSNFIDAGLTPYAAALSAARIPHGFFHGSLDEAARRQALGDYNAGKSRVLLMGPAAAEGISTRGTQLIQLLDPHWNEARLGQARGRGLRFDSHEGLPPELRNVRIQRFVARMPRPGWLGKFFGAEDRPSADEILEAQSRRKEELNEQFRDVLRRSGTAPPRRPWFGLFG